MDIKKLIGETTEYDKKEAVETKRPKSWCKTVSAFANGYGGVLIFGVADDDNIVGLDDAKHDAEAISDIIKNRIDPMPQVHLSYQNYGDKTIILLKVAAGTEPPYYYKADGQLIAYIRMGNESVPASTHHLRELILRGANMAYDNLPSSFKVENMAFTKLRSVYKQRTGNDFIDTDFVSFGLVTDDGRLTNAGALLADETPIRHSRVFCTRWNGIDKAGGVIDAIDDEEYSGSLIILLQEAYNFVLRHRQKAWKKTADSRIELPDYPDRAVLEGLVNALIHRDYLEVGSEVHVDIFDDRLEIYSPGGMIDGTIGENIDWLNVSSKRRNPTLADVFGRLRYMDRRGSGFRKIIDDYQNSQAYVGSKCPRIISKHGEFSLILPNLNYKKSAEKNRQKKSAKKVDVTIKIIENILSNESYLKSKEIAIRAGLSPSRTRDYLRTMTIVEAVGNGRNRVYRLTGVGNESSDSL